MIQRIQTIFLALAAGADLSVFGLPFATVPKKIAASDIFTNDLLYNLQDNVLLMVAYGLSGLLALVSIFLFKDRKKQMLATKTALVMTVLSVILTASVLWQDSATMGSSVTPDVTFGSITPFVGIILLILANNFIKKDEKLVRSSYDRLR